MKIIATVRTAYEKTFLAEVSNHEIAIIRRGELYAGHPEDRIEVGAVIEVGKHWKRVSEINDAQKRLDANAASLRAVADLLETINVVVPPTPEPPQP